MKRVVFLAAAAATLVQFTKYDLTALQTLGCEIHMVCNMQEGNISQAALQETVREPFAGTMPPMKSWCRF